MVANLWYLQPDEYFLVAHPHHRHQTLADGGGRSSVRVPRPWQPGWNEAAHAGGNLLVSVLTPEGAVVTFSDPGLPPHPVPSRTCECGLYAMKPGREGSPAATPFIVGFSSLTGPVGGVVELAGRVIEHAHGYRAERARILHLLAFRGLALHHGADIAGFYQVPINAFVPW